MSQQGSAVDHFVAGAPPASQETQGQEISISSQPLPPSPSLKMAQQGSAADLFEAGAPPASQETQGQEASMRGNPEAANAMPEHLPDQPECTIATLCTEMMNLALGDKVTFFGTALCTCMIVEISEADLPHQHYSEEQMHQHRRIVIEDCLRKDPQNFSVSSLLWKFALRKNPMNSAAIQSMDLQAAEDEVFVWKKCLFFQLYAMTRIVQLLDSRKGPLAGSEQDLKAWLDIIDKNAFMVTKVMAFLTKGEQPDIKNQIDTKFIIGRIQPQDVSTYIRFYEKYLLKTPELTGILNMAVCSGSRITETSNQNHEVLEDSEYQEAHEDQGPSSAIVREPVEFDNSSDIEDLVNFLVDALEKAEINSAIESSLTLDDLEEAQEAEDPSDVIVLKNSILEVLENAVNQEIEQMPSTIESSLTLDDLEEAQEAEDPSDVIDSSNSILEVLEDAVNQEIEEMPSTIESSLALKNSEEIQEAEDPSDVIVLKNPILEVLENAVNQEIEQIPSTSNRTQPQKEAPEISSAAKKRYQSQLSSSPQDDEAILVNLRLLKPSGKSGCQWHTSGGTVFRLEANLDPSMEMDLNGSLEGANRWRTAFRTNVGACRLKVTAEGAVNFHHVTPPLSKFKLTKNSRVLKIYQNGNELSIKIGDSHLLELGGEKFKEKWLLDRLKCECLCLKVEIVSFEQNAGKIAQNVDAAEHEKSNSLPSIESASRGSPKAPGTKKKKKSGKNLESPSKKKIKIEIKEELDMDVGDYGAGKIKEEKDSKLFAKSNCGVWRMNCVTEHYEELLHVVYCATCHRQWHVFCLLLRNVMWPRDRGAFNCCGTNPTPEANQAIRGIIARRFRARDFRFIDDADPENIESCVRNMK